jgi:pimeloyl-ACP methyl ester carboxylesterase
VRKTEAILALLQHLDIKYVSIGCHSGGTISALDMLLHHPEILPPDKPGYIAIGSPWILPAHSGSTMMSIVECLPSGVISQTDKLARLINNHVGPMVGVSVGMSYAIVARLLPSPPPDGVEEDSRPPQRSSTLEERLWPEIIQRIYDSNIKGISNDAVLFLQKGCFSQSGWGDWGDYDKLIPRLGRMLRESGRNLRVDVFHAEKDSLVGDAGSKGSQWFDNCWQAGNEDVIDYRSTTVVGADHDGIWSLKWSAVETVFESISGIVEVV